MEESLMEGIEVRRRSHVGINDEKKYPPDIPPLATGHHTRSDDLLLDVSFVFRFLYLSDPSSHALAST
jgi:hypothetical protein